MGKRAPRRREEKLVTEFTCQCRDHQSSVEVHMDRTNHIGELSCRIRLVRFNAPIDFLSDPIDVYSDWIDECELVGGASRPQTREIPSLEDGLNCRDCRVKMDSQTEVHRFQVEIRQISGGILGRISLKGGWSFSDLTSQNSRDSSYFTTSRPP